MQAYWDDTRTMLISGAVLAGAIGLALVVHFVLFFVVEKILQRKGASTETIVTKRAKKSARIILPLLALVLAIPLVPLPATLKGILQHVLGLGVIASVGWGIIVLTELAGNLVFARYSMDSPDNLSARSGPAAFDLRCLVREGLVQFLRDKYPLSLPRQREEQIGPGKN